MAFLVSDPESPNSGRVGGTMNLAVDFNPRVDTLNYGDDLKILREGGNPRCSRLKAWLDAF